MEKTRARDKQLQLLSVMLFVFCPLSPLCLYALAKLQLGVFCDLMVLVKDDETDNNNNSSG